MYELDLTEKEMEAVRIVLGDIGNTNDVRFSHGDLIAARKKINEAKEAPAAAPAKKSRK